MIIFVSERVENLIGKGENACYLYFFFSHSVFITLLLQKCWNQGLIKASWLAYGFHRNKWKKWNMSGMHVFGAKWFLFISYFRKIEIVQYASRTRQLFIRLLALVKWANSASKVDKCAVSFHFLLQHGFYKDNSQVTVIALLSSVSLLCKNLPVIIEDFTSDMD